jgi:hypothetical protein
MNTMKNAREESVGYFSTRRQFNVTIAALLVASCTRLPVGSGSSSDRGRWILNEQDY